MFLKKMHFRISDDLTDKIDDIFKHIEEKLNIGLKEWFCKSEFNYCLKTKIYKRTKFNKKRHNDNILFQIKILNMNVNHYYKYSLFIMLRMIKSIQFIILKY